jgi:hypothetical protein
MRRLALAASAVCLVLLLQSEAMACPVCLGFKPQQPTFASELRAAKTVVIGVPTGEPGEFRVQLVARGAAELKATRISVPDANATRPIVLARSEDGDAWKNLGSSGAHLASFFKTILALPVDDPRDDAEWNARLSRVKPFLGHLDARIARSAWAEWARAPYRVIRQQRLEPAQLRVWLADNTQAYAHPLWIVMLGIVGDAQDMKDVNGQLAAAWRANDATLLAARLTARIEREGDGGVAWLEKHYIRDRERMLEEIQAAVTALAVQGAANEPLRPRILSACRLMLAERRPLSGLVAPQFAAAGDASAVEHYRNLLASGEPVLPSTVRAIQSYLATFDAPSTTTTASASTP